MPDRIVNSPPDYVGGERRQDKPDVILISQKSFSWIIAVVTLVGILVSWGVSWGTSKAAINDKVNIADQIRVDARQDMERETMKIEMVNSKIDRAIILAKLDSIGVRVSQMYCEGKPKSCR